jgi:UDP-glucose 4-epimerase
MSRVLVTGGAGFIGSHLARRALSEGHSVVVVDNLSTGYRHQIPDGADFIYADLGNPAHYGRLRDEKPDVIFHLAAQSSGWVSFDSPMRDLEDNTHATILLSQWALQQGCKRLLFASTESVFGEGTGRNPFDEKSLPLPLSFYGASKLACEHYLRISHNELGLEHTCLRLFTVYGPKQDLANMRQGIVSIYLSYILKGGPVTVTGSLDRVRDLVIVDDVVDAFWRASQTPATIGKELVVATGEHITLGQLIKDLGKAFGHPDIAIETTGGTPGDVMESYGNSALLRELTGWKPTCTVADGIARIRASFPK